MREGALTITGQLEQVGADGIEPVLPGQAARPRRA
jgi:hypothetical protein